MTPVLKSKELSAGGMVGEAVAVFVPAPGEHLEAEIGGGTPGVGSFLLTASRARTPQSPSPLFPTVSPGEGKKYCPMWFRFWPSSADAMLEFTRLKMSTGRW